MNKIKLVAIGEYLSEKLPGCHIEQKRDFEYRAQHFKVFVKDENLLLRVDDEFVSDNDIPEILRLFNQWSLAEILAKESALGVSVSGRGLETFQRG